MDETKRVLCVYATRQVDSNLMMASTVFAGLQKCGYHVDALFCGTETVCGVFRNKYARYFEHVEYLTLASSFWGRLLGRSSWTKLFHSFFLHFFIDMVWRPYTLKTLKGLVKDKYEVVLSFVPPVLSSRLGRDVVYRCLGGETRLVQFWTDPLSIGGCSDISEIPMRRRLHVLDERRILSFADKIVFCYPLLCEMEQRLHPMYADKMTWSDVGYIEHERDNYKPDNSQVTIGLFGAYQRKVRNIAPFLNAISNMPNVCFIIRGDSDVVIDSTKYPNLDVRPGRCPVDEIERLEQECDVLVSLCGRYTVMPPGKTFYMANYHKPILFIADGPRKEYMIDYLNGLGRYICCNNTVDSIESGLRLAIACTKDFKLEMPIRMRLDVIARKIIEE